MEREYNVGTWLTPSDEYIKDIKQTLVENNYANENTPIGELNPIVQQVIDEVPETFEKMDLSKKEKVISTDFDYYFEVKNGIDAYGSYGSTPRGLWHINLQTNEKTQIFSDGYKWGNFYIDSKKNVYVSSITSSTGVLKLNGNVALQLFDSGAWTTFFETSKNELYVGGTGVKGLLHIDGEIVTPLDVDRENYWYSFFETSTGIVYASPKDNATVFRGIYLLEKNSLINIYQTGGSWGNFFETKNGDVYVGSTLSTFKLLLKLKGNSVTTIDNQFYGYNITFEDSRNVCYLTVKSNSNTYKLEDDTLTRVYSGNQVGNIFEDSKGNLYGVTGLKLVYYKDTKFTDLYNGNYWINFFESTKGNLYVGGSENKNSSYISSDTTDGLLKLNGENVTKLNGHLICKYFTEKPEGLIASQTPQPDGSDFLLIDEDTDQVYLVKGGE